ncbi:MAG: glycosyltransferase family 39 protein [bacterium]
MKYLIFFLSLTAFRFIVGWFLPVIGDEGCYWIWSQNLDLSYVGHPPMIAYYIRLMTTFFGHNLIAFRFGALLLVSAITYFVYLIAKELFDKHIGLKAAVIFSLIPTFLGGSIFLVPQQLFLFFWTLSLLVFVKLVKSGKAYWWYILGVCVGLGWLSDYIMVFFFPAVGLYLILNKEMRFWWTRKEPYLGLLLSLVVFSPVIIWNFQHAFAPIAFWSGRSARTPNYTNNLLTFLVLQAVLYTPIIFGLLVNLYEKLWLYNKRTTLLACFSLPVLVPFLILSPLMDVGSHWTAAAYIPVVIFLSQLKSQRAKTFVTLTVMFGILINLLAFSYYLFFYPTPQELLGRETKVNQELSLFLKQYTPPQGKTYYVSNNLGVAGLVALYGQVRAYMAPGRLLQHDIWGNPPLEPGDNVIYFVHNEKELEGKLRNIFTSVYVDPQKRVFTKDADIPQKTVVLHCWGYMDGKLP